MVVAEGEGQGEEQRALLLSLARLLLPLLPDWIQPDLPLSRLPGTGTLLVQLLLAVL